MDGRRAEPLGGGGEDGPSRDMLAGWRTRLVGIAEVEAVCVGTGGARGTSGDEPSSEVL